MNPSRVRWGITLILIGLVFLANNLGQLSWWVWYDLLHLWPVLLIVIGLEVIVKRSKLQILGYLSSLIVVATFAYVVIDNRGNPDDEYGSYPSSRSEVSVSYENQATANFKIKFDDGRLYFNTSDDKLFRAVAENSRRDLQLIPESSGSSSDITLSPGSKHFRRWVNVGSNDNHWKCYIRPEVAGNYNLDLAGTDLRFFGQDLKVDRLAIQADRSDLVVRLGKQQARCDVNLSGDNTDLDIYFPDSAGVRIEGTYPSQTDIDAFKLTDRGGYLSNDLYDRAAVNFTVKTELKQGKVRVSSY